MRRVLSALVALLTAISVTVVLAPSASAAAYTVTSPDISVNEASGTASLVFTINPVPTAPDFVTLQYQTADASATAPADYTATTATLTWDATTGATRTMNIPIFNDALVEGNETFVVNRVGPGTASAGSTVASPAQVIVTIVDDEPGTQSAFSVNDVTSNEGNTGTTPFVFAVTINPPLTGTTQMTVNYFTTDGTATIADSDYAFQSGTIVFTSASAVATRTINVTGDAKVEPNETLNFNLSGPTCSVGPCPGTGPTIARTPGIGNITNDDGGPSPTPGPGALTVNAGRGDASPPRHTTSVCAIPVTLSQASSSTVTVHYATADSTAKAGKDYVPAEGTLTFAPGQTSKTADVTVNGRRARRHGPRNFRVFLNISSPTGGAALGTTPGKCAIHRRR